MGEWFNGLAPKSLGDPAVLLNSSGALQGTSADIAVQRLPPAYVAQAVRYLLLGGPPPAPPFGGLYPGDVLVSRNYFTSGEDPQPRAAPRDGVDAQPLPDFRGNIPGTDILDEGRPEDATASRIDSDRYEPDRNMDRAMERRTLPQGPFSWRLLRRPR